MSSFLLEEGMGRRVDVENVTLSFKSKKEGQDKLRLFLIFFIQD
jgi:hypothetical protein